jgi:hypothetical protein
MCSWWSDFINLVDYDAGVEYYLVMELHIFVSCILPLLKRRELFFVIILFFTF